MNDVWTPEKCDRKWVEPEPEAVAPDQGTTLLNNIQQHPTTTTTTTERNKRGERERQKLWNKKWIIIIINNCWKNWKKLKKKEIVGTLNANSNLAGNFLKLGSATAAPLAPFRRHLEKWSKNPEKITEFERSEWPRRNYQSPFLINHNNNS